MSASGVRCTATSFAMLSLLLYMPGALSVTSCASSVQSALSTITFNLSGLNFPCCQTSRADCHLTDADCVGDFSDFASCIVAAGSAACGISFSPTTGSPCAAYKGTVGSYGVSPVVPGGLQFKLDNIVQENWPNLGLDDSVVLCCLDDNGPCHIGELDQDNINPCKKGQYELFCVGDADHGMCTVRANTTHTQEVGQYFRINLDPADAPSTSSASSISIGPTSTFSLSGKAPSEKIVGPSQTAGAIQTSQTRRKNLALAVSLPVALGLLLLCTCVVFFMRWRRRRRAAESEVRQISPVQFVASTESTSSPISSGSGAASSQPLLGGKRAQALAQARMTQAESELDSDSRFADYSITGAAPPSYSELRA
ncbi:hypothetical protein AURDEDRAFT_148369 [Auricularia subglabra TFB-10046 SS5]|nr:hypothetical protein AURDEDRAFT_148369 [Auricularia subglabra TFB-10046 SS5]